MRALFIEAAIDIATREGLGIAGNCLALIRDRIDQVIVTHGQELRDRTTFAKAYGDFQEFISRMAREARQRGYDELHEDTFVAARERCGLIFWCEM
jgi:hypothetical protein